MPLVAAEFRFKPGAEDCEIRLDGDIERGDLEKLKSQLPDGMGPGKAGPTMCLNSKGGDFMEGLKLAEFVSGGIATTIPANSSCESACGWIFMAGSHLDTGGSEWSRGMDSRATLSFHAPLSVTAKAIIEAYSQAVSELGRETDVIRACVVGSAFGNEFWNDDYLSIAEAEEYEAFYDSRSRTLVAEMVVEGLAHIACEIEFEFDENLSSLKDGHIAARINVGSDESVTKSWIRDRYASKSIELPDFAVLNPKTLLKHLVDIVDIPIKPQNPSSLATLSFPSWCKSQAITAPDEKAVCETPRLTTYEIFLDRYYNKALANTDSQSKSKLQSQQRAWLTRRRSCNDDVECIAQAYHSRIAALKESP